MKEHPDIYAIFRQQYRKKSINEEDMCEGQGRRDVHKVVKMSAWGQKIMNLRARGKGAFPGTAPFIFNMLP